MNERTTHTTDSSGSNTGNSWMDHPAINGMDPVKLELIRLAAKLKEGRPAKEQEQIDQMVQMVRTHMKNHT